MKIATALFTYNRSKHTKLVLEGLKQNCKLPEMLFVFQDGIKKKEHEEEWEKVNKLIYQIDWCDTEIIVSNYNKGLSNSIVSGINYVFEKYDAVIVLEDDCVPTANFFCFMNQCFEKYKSDKNVYSISGYSWPIELSEQPYDVYACGRISSWGWGTWKDRWKIYEKDYELIKKMKQKAIDSQNLAIWGNDLEDILIGNIKGECDSWAVFWALNVIFRQGICIAPYYSFIENIGMDGSGVHCKTTKRFEVASIDESKTQFSLPDKIEFLNETKHAFASLYGSYTAINKYSNDRKKVLIYGAGNFFKRNEKQINENYYILKFVDINKKGYFAGREVIRPNKIKECEFEKIVIMIQDETECIKIACNIKEKYGVPEEKIEYGVMI